MKMDVRAMQHTCQMSLASFLETRIDIFNYYYYAILRPKFHLSKHLWNICYTATHEIILFWAEQVKAM